MPKIDRLRPSGKRCPLAVHLTAPADLSRIRAYRFAGCELSVIDVQVGRLRKRIEPEGTTVRLIRTERGAGYVFSAAVEIVR
jgi:DNA-binding response OmpR family regulator